MSDHPFLPCGINSGEIDIDEIDGSGVNFVDVTLLEGQYFTPLYIIYLPHDACVIRVMCERNTIRVAHERNTIRVRRGPDANFARW